VPPTPSVSTASLLLCSVPRPHPLGCPLTPPASPPADVGDGAKAIAARTVRVEVKGSPLWPTVTGANGHRVSCGRLGGLA
jgi:hypothetical protein